MVGWEEGAGRHGAQAGLGVSPKHINFMLLPGAISSRMVSDAGKHPALVITFQTHPWDEGSSLYLPLQTNRTLNQERLHRTPTNLPVFSLDYFTVNLFLFILMQPCFHCFSLCWCLPL